jgi:hypothetical protein
MMFRDDRNYGSNRGMSSKQYDEFLFGKEKKPKKLKPATAKKPIEKGPTKPKRKK